MIQANIRTKALCTIFLVTLFFSAILPLLLQPNTTNAGADDWYDTDWSYRLPVNIIAGTNNATNYQLRFMNLHTGNGTSNSTDIFFNEKAKDYFDDIRVTDSDGTTLLPYALLDETQTTAELAISINVTASTNKTIYAYYGNSDATRASDIHNVFLQAVSPPTKIQIDTENNIPAKANRQYDSWPSIYRASTGEIIAMYSKPNAHAWDSTSNTSYRISNDGGRTWDAVGEVVFDYPTLGKTKHGIMGALEITINSTPYIIVSIAYSSDGTLANYRSYTSKTTLSSMIAGTPNWSEPVMVIDDVSGATSPIIEMSNGNLMISFVDFVASPKEVYSSVSSDDGDTWNTPVLITDDAGNYGEPSLIELDDSGSFNGDIYCLMRDSSGSSPWNAGRCISSDYGSTWGAVAASGITQTGVSSDQLRMIRASDSTLYCVYSYYAGNDDGDIRVIKASSESAAGITWDTTNYSQPWQHQEDTLNYAHYAYPAICEIEDGGQLGVIYYLKTDAVNNDSYIYFSYVEPSSFIGSGYLRRQGTSCDLRVENGYINVEEIPTGSNGALLTMTVSQTDYITEWKARINMVDSNFLGIRDASESAYFSFVFFPQKDSDNIVKYYEQVVLRNLYNKGSSLLNDTYNFRVLTNESVPEVTHSIYNTNWTQLAIDGAAQDAAIGSPLDADQIYVGSGATNFDASYYLYNEVIRQHLASPPAWGTIDAEEEICVPTIATLNTTLIEETTATFNGNITNCCAYNVSSRGFVWGTTTQSLPSNTTAPPAGYNSSWTQVSNYGNGTYSYNITALTQGGLYFIRACANSTARQGSLWGYGNEEMFLTKPVEPNTFTTIDGVGESIDLSWVKGAGALNTEIWGKQNSYPTSRGDGSLTYNSTGTSTTDNNPSCGEQWYYRAWSYVTEGGLSHYSDTYDEDNALCVGVLSITTNAATLIEETFATMNGNITNICGENASVRGFQYDTDSGVPYSLNWTETGSFGVNTYSRNVTGLSEGELYHFRATANNSGGWGNGSELTLLTKPDEPTALLNTSRTSTSIATSWTSGNGSDYYIVRYDTSDYPVDYSSGTMACNVSSTTCNATALISGQLHYFRIWSWCTEDGLQRWSDTYNQTTAYTSPADVTLFDAFNPSASTIDLSWIKGIGSNSTHIRGQQGSYPANVSSGTQIYFDVGSSTTHDGLGQGETWYYRAWSYDSESGLYSDSYDQDFETTTAIGSPTIVTIAASLVEETTATITGNVTIVNDTNIIERGFQYDLDSAPPYTWNWTQNGTYGLGTFTYNMTSLTQGELYNFRAIAENDNPTWGYGSELQFLTKPEAPIGLASTNTTDNTISLSWTTGNGSQQTMIRYATGSYPATYNDGTQGYFGSSNTTTITALDPGITYYLRAWSYATEDSLVQYSDSYSETTATTTGSAGGIDLEVRGNLRMLGLVLLPIGLMAIGFWQKKQWVMMMAGISFIGLGAYGIVDAEGTWGSSMIVGAASFIFATIVLIYATMRMREAPEPDVDVPLDEDEMERQARKNIWKERDKERKERRDDLL